MPQTRSKTGLVNDKTHAYPTPISVPILDHQPPLELSGYNFAIVKMHELLSKLPQGQQSEMKLVMDQDPNLNQYMAWKTVSYLALNERYTVKQTCRVFVVEYGYLNHLEAVKDEIQREQVARTLTNLSSVSILGPSTGQNSADGLSGYGSFGYPSSTLPQSITTAATTPFSSLPTPFSATLINDQSPSPIFPDPRFLPPPRIDDTCLVDKRAEDMLRRWVSSGEKEDVTVERLVRGPDGSRNKRLCTGYVIDGKLFEDVGPDFKQARAIGSNSSKPRIIKFAKSSLAGRSITVESPGYSMPIPNKRCSPNKESDFASVTRPQKRTRSASSNEPGRSDAPTPKKQNQSTHRTFNEPNTSRKISSSSSGSAASGVSEKDIANLRSILQGQSMDHVMDAFEATGQSVMPAPPLPFNRRQSANNAGAQSTPTPSRVTRRRSRPTPLTLAPPPVSLRSISRHNTPTPSSAVTPQRSSIEGTPHRNKYVPTTPNPARWTSNELYFLNKLARKGLHPTELHPQMTDEFPDVVRSQHAIKDRRDKMKRAGELVGKMPNYAARYPKEN